MEMTLIEELLTDGGLDWVPLDNVYGIASRASSDPIDRRAIALGLVADLLHRDLMVAGVPMSGPGGFSDWNASPAESFQRIASYWVSFADPRPAGVPLGSESDTPDPFFFWLRLTDRGRALAEEIASRSPV